MLSTASHNTNVAEFTPSKENPIFPWIARRYPCQEDIGNKVNEFSRLTWKIQQPDPNMVFSAVKLVLPLEMSFFGPQGSGTSPVDVRLRSRQGACNMALAETPMKAFRSTSLNINGKQFTEQNTWKETLDACYRGLGAQAYGDNHSLRPVVTRSLINPDEFVWINPSDSQNKDYVRVQDASSDNFQTLLDNNGPFLERARIFQQGLSDDGTAWTGEISSYLECGPFQARARIGNAAVPYIHDMHLQMQFHTQPAQFDRTWPAMDRTTTKSRVMAPRLLEFATVPNYRPEGISDLKNRFLANVDFRWTAKPYLEVTYTKFPSPMQSSYLLRCLEHQYEASLPRFQFDLNSETRVHQAVKSRITSRLLSYPTKIYIWAEQSDEWKGAYISGGCRRSCRLQNMHCRINQRPNVLNNPTQEVLYEMFQRNTNSSLEFGAWKQSPIYCFTPADLGQPDMQANDARLSWFEFDADVALTDLQLREQQDKTVKYLKPSGYAQNPIQTSVTYPVGSSKSGVQPRSVWDVRRAAAIGRFAAADQAAGVGTWAERTDESQLGVLLKNDIFPSAGQSVELHATHSLLDPTHMQTYVSQPFATDVQITAVQARGISWRGLIFARVNMNNGQITGNKIFYVPETYRFLSDQPIDTIRLNAFSVLDEVHDQAAGTFTYSVPAAAAAALVPWTGTFCEHGANRAAAANQNRTFGNANLGANGGGCRAFIPGPIAYRTDGNGIDNAGGPLQPTVFGAHVDNNYNPVDESQIGLVRWCAFAPSHQMVGVQVAYKHYLRWKATDAGEYEVANAMSRYHLGQQFVWASGTAVCDAVANTGQIQVDTVFPQRTLSEQGSGGAYGPIDWWQVMRVRQDDPIGEKNPSYQMRALYEFGNCQYEFSRGETPVRVLPNFVPVGPSRGIPQLE